MYNPITKKEIKKSPTITTVFEPIQINNIMTMFDPAIEYTFTSYNISVPTTPPDYLIRKVLTYMRMIVLHI